MLRTIIFISFIALFVVDCLGQKKTFTGTVNDATSKAPLAFVSVQIKESNNGTTTDIDGRFSFAQTPEKFTLIVSYIGYKTKNITVENKMPLHIEIEQSSKELEVVVIGGGENPAHRIIQLMQQNRKKNDPEFQPSFKYNAYTVAALGGGSTLFNTERPDTLAKEIKNFKAPKQTGKDKKKDSATAVIQQLFKENYLMVTESYTERIFRFPNRSKETVLASKVSGLKQAAFAITSTNFQPFGFYKDYLPMGDKSFVSPVIQGSIGLYKFRLKEILAHEEDTTFIISFEPKKGKNFNGLKGLLYINSDGYAIENVIASAAEEKEQVMRFRIQQKYERITGHWFPLQLNTTIAQTDIKTDSVLIY